MQNLFLELIAQEMVVPLFLALVGLLGGVKIFRDLNEDMSPRERLLWIAWCALLVIIIVFALDGSLDIPLIKGLWSFLTGILVARFVVEDKVNKLHEKA